MTPVGVANNMSTMEAFFFSLLSLIQTERFTHLYVRKRDSGLGVPCLANLLSLTYFKASMVLGSVVDSIIEETIHSDYCNTRMFPVVQSLGPGP